MAPTFMKANVNESVRFLCLSKSTTTWKFNKGPLPKNSEVFRIKTFDYNWLRLSNVQLENSGTYECVGNERRYLYFHAYAVLEVSGKV